MTDNGPQEPEVLDLTGEDIDKVGEITLQPIVELPEPSPELVEDPREVTRAQLARGLLLILASALAGVFLFIGFGQLDGLVLTQSIFPSLVGLAGTALGFYFGAETRGGSGTT